MANIDLNFCPMHAPDEAIMYMYMLTPRIEARALFTDIINAIIL